MIFEFDNLDVKKIRTEYLDLSQAELAKLLGYATSYVAAVERQAKIPKDYYRKLQLLILERRVSMLEKIVNSCETNNKLLDFLEKNK